MKSRWFFSESRPETYGELPLCGRARMSQETYRYYCLDGVGRLHSAEWFEAESDADAIAQIEALHPDALCEIWQGQRLVAKLSPRRLQA